MQHALSVTGALASWRQHCARAAPTGVCAAGKNHRVGMRASRASWWGVCCSGGQRSGADAFGVYRPASTQSTLQCDWLARIAARANHNRCWVGPQTSAGCEPVTQLHWPQLMLKANGLALQARLALN